MACVRGHSGGGPGVPERCYNSGCGRDVRPVHGECNRLAARERSATDSWYSVWRTGVTDERTLMDALLTEVETRELISLRWGYADGVLPETEVIAAARAVLASHASTGDPETLLTRAVARGLLFLVGDDGINRTYRSRFAEGVRLLSRIRLLTKRSPWYAEDDLVADFRVDVRPRLVPRRDIDPSQVLTQLALPARSLQHRLAQAMLQPGGQP